MNQPLTTLALTPADRAALTSAVSQLENPNFAARLADYAGAPVPRIMRSRENGLGERIWGK